MKKELYKPVAYALVVKTRLIFLCIGMHGLYAQDTIHFNAVEIKVNKIEISQLGKKIETSDSVVKELYRFNSVSDYLTSNSSVFIKSYGQGAVSTTALRGGNAGQTAVLWNGFNLQNTMLGQSDLALLPNFLFDEISVEYGGSSSVWGSGAIGGSIQLSSKQKFNTGSLAAIHFGTRSFGGMSLATQALISKKRFISSSKFYINDSDNHFNYQDTSDQANSTKEAKYNAYAIRGFMQEFKFLIKNNQTLNVSAWIQAADRKLPATDWQNDSKTNQTDQALRLTADWHYSKFNFMSILKSGYFQDRLNYNDSLHSTYSKSLTKTVMLESENYFTWFHHQQFNLSFNALNSSAESNNYLNKKAMNRLSLLAGNKFSFWNDQLRAYASVRFEYYAPTKLPVTGSLAIDYEVFRGLHLKASASKVYRQPSLNEMYWQPGGNENLKAEQGYTNEGELVFMKGLKRIKFEVSLAAYSRTISDWILWVPGANGNPSPTNIQSVWSRGTETTFKAEYHSGKMRTGFLFVTSYVLSTVKSTEQQNDNSLGKQLIYTPRYLVNSRVFFGYQHVDFYVFYNYVGYRFTSSDNLSWLTPYHILALKLNYSLPFQQVAMNAFVSCNNLLNANYTVIANRPMPLRNYELGISLQFKNKNK